MPELNPDFRQADEVVVPDFIDTSVGWTDGTVSIAEADTREKFGADRLEKDMPLCFNLETPTVRPEIKKKFDEFQKSKGRYPGSCDWSLLDEFVLKLVLAWLPQIIGSCVVSNTFRGWTIKLMYQIVMLGLPMEHLGRNQFGPQNFSFYGPFTYGSARRRGNMRSGDGLYCDVMAESLLKDGVLPCNTPKLLEICKAAGAANDKDFPEPQSASFYRKWGNWAYLDEVKQYADYRLRNGQFVSDADTLKVQLETCGITLFCSGIAIRKVGTHKDGFAIHKRDPGNSWPHNMCFHGFFIASDGELFFRVSNESWGTDVIYNVPFDEVVDWYKNRRPTSYAMGIIEGPASTPPLIK